VVSSYQLLACHYLPTAVS